ncbi:MAG: hypothetical protein KC656_04240 [Myxococcales bacterium]|nr:hypothetical protein [Myxococcales bacterium]
MNRALPLFLGLLVGCPPATPVSTDPTDPTDVPTPTDEPLACTDSPDAGAQDGVCGPDLRVGGFTVDEQEDFTVVSGQVFDSLNPQNLLEPAVTEGDCVLLSRPVLFCDPACGAGEVCDGETCVPYPLSVDMGTVFISGLETCVEMAPIQPGNTYTFNTLPYPGMQAGDLVQLDAAAVQLHAAGVEPIVFPAGDWVMVEGQPLEITWTPPSAPGSQVAVSMSIDQHGASPLRLDCSFDDDGSGTVPAALVDQLINSGVSGYPSASIRRRTADKATLAQGCVELVVASSRPHGLDVDGYTPCSRPEDCPSPQVCDLPNEICVDP